MTRYYTISCKLCGKIMDGEKPSVNLCNDCLLSADCCGLEKLE